MQRIVSGIQPTGNLHLGNYLGAVKNWIELQNIGEYEIYFFIADLHSLTGKLMPEELHKQRRILIAELLALGIDQKKVTFFRQSDVVGHADLTWIFNCVTPISELKKMTQFKDKSDNQSNNINAGLFTYPILQAADILMYHGHLVPVGEDQIQHLELTRDVARFFNNKYGEYFPETKEKLTHIPKVKSLLAPDKKMSKSLGVGHAIDLADEPEVIQKKLNKAVTGTEGGEESVGVKNLLLLLKEFGSKDDYAIFEAQEKDGTIRYGDLKKVLAVSISKEFEDFREKRAEFLENPKKLDKIMEDGAKKAQVQADKTMREVRKLIGLS